MLGQKGKSNTRKKEIKLEEIKLSIGERVEIEKISTKGKTMQTKQDILKQRKKIRLTSWRNDTKTYQQPDASEAEQFWSNI